MVDISSPAKRFKIVNSYIGLGKPKNSLWFIGLEEASEWDECWEADRDDYEAYSNKKTRYEEEGKEPIGNVYNYISQICIKLLEPSVNISSEKFRKEHLFKKNCPVFQTNLYPLGKKCINSKPDKYVQLFSINLDNYYCDETYQGRWESIYKKWKNSRPIATVCFGKGNWSQFIKLLKLGEPDDSRVSKKNRVNTEIYSNEMVLLTYFLGRGFQTEVIESVTSILKEFNITLTL